MPRPPASARFAQAPQQVRIIGGQWKRTPLAVAALAGLRPTPARVRETLFNWLAHLRPDVTALRGLDLFAGTGALGFELASRGARAVTLVERAAPLLAQLQAAKAKLGAAQISIVAGDGLAYAASAPQATYDLIFLDPPFDANLLKPALAAVRRLLAPDGLVYVESGAALAESDLAERGLRPVRNGRAGGVHFCLLAPGDA